MAPEGTAKGEEYVEEAIVVRNDGHLVLGGGYTDP